VSIHPIKGKNLKTQNIVEDIMESENHGTKGTETKTNERIFRTPAGDVNLNELNLNRDKFKQTTQTTQTTDNNQESKKIERKAFKTWTGFFKAQREQAKLEGNMEKYLEMQERVEQSKILDKFTPDDWINHFTRKMETAAKENDRKQYVINTTKLERAEQIAARERVKKAFPEEEKLPIEKKKNEFIAMDNYPKKQKNQSWSDYYTQTTKFFEKEGNIEMLERQISKRDRALRREEEAKQQPENTNKLNLSKSRSR